ncbi:MAG: SH3 domain-containing protein [Oscillospiraceae bacterium]|nr:SH3 domain-containing protein [Oscillospiraceae bacterium]
MKHLNRDTLQKLFVTLAVFICLALSVGITARADSEGAATVTASALNMRSEASTSSSIVTCVSKGTVVLVTGSSDGWYQVWYQGKSGYMSADYLTFSTSAESAFGTGTISGSAVRVRSGPSTSDSILATVYSGETMTVTGVSGEWYQVSYNGSTGYVHSAYMTISYGSSSTTTSTSTTEAAPLAVATTGTGTINASYVRMRSGPSTSYSILGTYSSGTTMTVTGTSGDWYEVSYNGVTGYVYSRYLTLDSGSTSTSSSSSSTSTSSFTVTEMDDTAAAVTTAVHMRTGPSTSYASLQVLSAGTSVTITGYSGSWYRVSYNGSTGYIYSSYVTTDTSSTTSSSSSSSSSTSAGEAIVAEAKKYLGVSYVYGGTSPSGFDCSGLVYYVYKQCGYSITRTASSQNSDGTYVSRDNLQPGDIIVFYNSAMTGIGHVGIYIGDGQFIHASSGSGKVIISSLSATYYNSHYYSARRIVS